MGSLILTQQTHAESQPGGMMSHGDISWDEDLKPWLFEDREIQDGSSIMKLDVPTRPQDASVEALIPQEPNRYIKTLMLIVDHNPFAVAATFHLTPETGFANVSTRLVAIDGSIALSEDPVFEFAFAPNGEEELSIEAVDSKDNHFDGTWPVEAKGT